jgi:hypothetical protein
MLMLVWLTKIVLLPFEMVGSLFTGGGDNSNKYKFIDLFSFWNNSNKHIMI